jgi:hypothetical protein
MSLRSTASGFNKTSVRSDMTTEPTDHSPKNAWICALSAQIQAFFGLGGTPRSRQLA